MLTVDKVDSGSPFPMRAYNSDFSPTINYADYSRLQDIPIWTENSDGICGI